ncbi:MAG: hypothetical protein CVV21_08780 [Candidatus Goldiibacteriota bacterium HGW-Goldbacteria-1]|jgi:peroxiredoxin|nr:MAG: hypothetical protein CVV21_08780 [Candidatus Goldiibacteriota bacterium HGW-Goldbacteria-1]
MKRLLIASLIFFSILGLILITVQRGRSKKTVNHLTAGTPYISFPVGYKDSAAVNLDNFTGKSSVVLCFTDKSINSEKLKTVLNKQLRGFTDNYLKVIWFNIALNEKTAEISEFNNRTPRYIFSLNDLPKQYDLTVMPVIYVIDKTGTIKMIYRGFSPTVISDLAGVF